MPFTDDHANGVGRGLHVLARKPWIYEGFEASGV